MSIIYEEYLTPEERNDKIQQCLNERANIMKTFLKESAYKKAEISEMDLSVRLLQENGTYDDYAEGLIAIESTFNDFNDQYENIVTENLIGDAFNKLKSKAGSLGGNGTLKEIVTVTANSFSSLNSAVSTMKTLISKSATLNIHKGLIDNLDKTVNNDAFRKSISNLVQQLNAEAGNRNCPNINEKDLNTTKVIQSLSTSTSGSKVNDGLSTVVNSINNAVALNKTIADGLAFCNKVDEKTGKVKKDMWISEYDCNPGAAVKIPATIKTLESTQNAMVSMYNTVINQCNKTIQLMNQNQGGNP